MQRPELPAAAPSLLLLTDSPQPALALLSGLACPQARKVTASAPSLSPSVLSSLQLTALSSRVWEATCCWKQAALPSRGGAGAGALEDAVSSASTTPVAERRLPSRLVESPSGARALCWSYSQSLGACSFVGAEDEEQPRGWSCSAACDPGASAWHRVCKEGKQGGRVSLTHCPSQGPQIPSPPRGAGCTPCASLLGAYSLPFSRGLLSWLATRSSNSGRLRLSPASAPRTLCVPRVSLT